MYTHIVLCVKHLTSWFPLQIRPIDKKQQYQIQKLVQAGENAAKSDIQSKEPDASNKSEDASKYRPNPDMLVSKVDLTLQVSQCICDIMNGV